MYLKYHFSLLLLMSHPIALTKNLSVILDIPSSHFHSHQNLMILSPNYILKPLPYPKSFNFHHGFQCKTLVILTSIMETTSNWPPWCFLPTLYPLSKHSFSLSQVFKTLQSHLISFRTRAKSLSRILQTQKPGSKLPYFCSPIIDGSLFSLKVFFSILFL